MKKYFYNNNNHEANQGIKSRAPVFGVQRLVVILSMTILLAGYSLDLKSQTIRGFPNLALSATPSTSGGGAGANFGPTNLNDNDADTLPNNGDDCWVSTPVSNGNPVGFNNWFQFSWNASQKFNRMRFIIPEPNNRTTIGGTIQIWKNGQWINHHTFNVSPPRRKWIVNFPGVTTTRVRVANFVLSSSGQSSNPEFDEVQVYFNPPIPPTAAFSLPDTVFVSERTCIANESQNDTANVWYIDGKRQSTNDVLKYIPGNPNSNQTISLAVANSRGTDSISKDVFVKSISRPEAGFIADKNIVDPLEAVEFSDQSKGGPTSYEWNFAPLPSLNTFIDDSKPTSQSCFGIPNSDSAREPVVNFLFPGTYDVEQIVSNRFGSDTLLREDYIIVRDAIGSICQEASSNFGYGRILDNGGAENDYSNNVNCTFTINTCKRTILNFESFDLAKGDFLRVYDGKSSNASPLWDTAKFGSDGLTGDRSDIPAQVTAESGHVFIEFSTDSRKTAPGFNITWVVQDKQFNAPQANISGPDTVCPGEMVTYRDTSNNLWAEYRWDSTGVNDTGKLAEGKVINVRFPYSGTWNLGLSAGNCADTVMTNKTVVVQAPNKAPNTGFSANNRRPVVGQPVSFTDSSASCASFVEWSFSGPVNFMDGDRNSPNPRVSFSKSGCYDVTLRVGNGFDTVSLTKTCYVDVRCIPAVSILNSDLGFNRVSIAGIDNSSQTGVAGYTSYFQQSGGSVERGGTYQLILSRKTNFNSMRAKVWLDIDGDNNFDEPNELLAQVRNMKKQYTTKVEIPDTTQIGNLRLRVGGTNNSSSLMPCGVNTFGEYEDYKLEVTPDQTPPKIMLQGPDTVSLSACGTLNVVDTGTFAMDAIDGRINQVQKQVLVDSSTAGLDSIRYTAIDSNGNEATRIRYVKVLADGTAPQVSLQGSDTVMVSVNSTYTDAGLSDATDNCAGIIDTQVVKEVNTDTLGLFPYTYRVTDAAGNSKMVTRYVEVRDTTAPMFSLAGNNPQRIRLNGTYKEAGITGLQDNFWPDDDLRLSIDNPVITGGLDTFTVTYKVMDGSGNRSMKKRTVIIEDRTAPSISGVVNSGDTVTVEAGEVADLSSNVTVRDNSGRQVSLQRTGSYFNILDGQGRPRSLGYFTGNWIFTDGSGNADTLSLVVQVEDTQAPTLSLKGSRTTTIERWTRTKFEDFDSSVVVSDNHVITSRSVDTTATYFSEYIADSFTTGFFELRYTATDSAGNSSSIERVIRVKQPVTGISGQAEGVAVKVYPNPTAGALNVKLGDVIEQGSIRVLNAQGQVVKRVASDAQLRGSYRLNLAKASDGIYFLEIAGNNERIIKRFVLNR